MDTPGEEGGDTVTGVITAFNTSVAVQKRGLDNQFTEKLVGVRNAQCDHQLNRQNKEIESKRQREMRKLREDVQKVMYDHKTMQIFQKKQEVIAKKKDSPSSDTEELEMDIMKNEKYLIYDPSQCNYTDKRNKFPMRLGLKSDASEASPVISLARRALHDYKQEEKQALKQSFAQKSEQKMVPPPRSVRFFVDSENESDDGEEDTVFKNDNKSDKGTIRKSKSKSATMVPPSTAPSGSVRRINSTNGGSKIYGLNRPKTEGGMKPNRQKYQARTFSETDKHDLENYWILLHPNKEHAQGKIALWKSELSPEKKMMHVVRHVGAWSENSSNSSENTLPPINPLISSSESFQQLDSNTNEFAHLKKKGRLGTAHSVSLDTFPTTKESSNITFDSKSLPPNQQPNTYTARRAATLSARSITRKHVTHDILKREKTEVESKVEKFFEQYGPIPCDIDYHKSVPQKEDSNNNENLDNEDDDTNQGNSEQMKEKWQEAGKKVLEALKNPGLGFGPNQARKPGIPSHAAERSKRHTPTFKLRKVVEDLIRQKSKMEMMEVEELRRAMDPHEKRRRSSTMSHLKVMASKSGSKGTTPDISKQGLDVVRKTPDLLRKTPDIMRRTPDISRRTPDISRRTPDISRSTPDMTAKKDVSLPVINPLKKSRSNTRAINAL